MFAVTGILQADDVPKDADLFGRPKQFISGKHRMFGIWYEEGIWKLRTTSGRGRRIEFLGVVEIDKDRITPDYTALDVEKRRADQDRVVMAKNRRKMGFKFVTIGFVDGIDFKVGKRAKTVSFQLRIADDDDPQFILIGAKGAHPKTAKFTLPAHPIKPKEPEKKPAAKSK